jgi:hypothetical protein
MLRTLEIPRAQWTSLLSQLARQLGDRPVRVEVEGRPLADQEMGQRLPLRSLDFDEAGAGLGSMTVTVGSTRGELSHRIVGPIQLYMALNELAEVEWLAIYEVSDLGMAETLLHFEPLPQLETRSW